jgi:glycosyltransferase involved in cell wall biosynthesis
MTMVSIIIPTFNRPAYLKRILRYYHQYGSALSVIVADSSSEENKKLNKETITESKYRYIREQYEEIVDILINKIVMKGQSAFCTLCCRMG